jgi:hypothetical protein
MIAVTLDLEAPGRCRLERDGTEIPVAASSIVRKRIDLSFFYREIRDRNNVRIDGDTATGRAHICELGRLKSGSSHLNYAIYHDRYRRTTDGWKFTERVYEIRYIDNSPLPGSPPGENGLGVDVSAARPHG